MTESPFFLGKSRYNQETYFGRFRHMLDLVDPSTLLCNSDDINTAVSTLKGVETGSIIPGKHFPHSVLWNYQKIKNSAVHPDTGDIIPMPFRMSGFLPFNAPVCIGALMATNRRQTIFFHWANQTHNALVNYCNRNASQEISTLVIAQGYLGAVGGSIGVAVGLQEAIKRFVKNPVSAQGLQRFTALPAIITAAALNVFLMRRGELDTGIDVLDKKGKVLGTSQAASKKALSEMILSRMVLPLPVFFLPPVGSLLIERAFPSIMKSSPRNRLVINAILLFIGFGFGLPATIAIFPQTGTIKVEDIEPTLAYLIRKNENSPDALYYNKGL